MFPKSEIRSPKLVIHIYPAIWLHIVDGVEKEWLNKQNITCPNTYSFNFK
jgi:hypothetical protein